MKKSTAWALRSRIRDLTASSSPRQGSWPAEVASARLGAGAGAGAGGAGAGAAVGSGEGSIGGAQGALAGGGDGGEGTASNGLSVWLVGGGDGGGETVFPIMLIWARLLVLTGLTDTLPKTSTHDSILLYCGKVLPGLLVTGSAQP